MRSSRKSEISEELSGPFQFYTTHRRCPQCHEMLLSQEPVTFGPASKIVHLLGLACYCMACNGHYRARPQAWIRPLPWVLGLLGAGVMACAIFLLASPGSSHWSGAFGMVLLVVSCVFLSRLLDISRRLWWRLVPLKKIYTYQEGFM